MFISLMLKSHLAASIVVISSYGSCIFRTVEHVQTTFIAEGGPHEPKNSIRR